MTHEQASDMEKIKAKIRERRIQRIRERSAIPFSVLRQRKAAQDGLTDPTAQPEEDALRSRNMITSANVLDLHLSELRDAETFGPGMHSERTQELASKVAFGFAWTIDFDVQYAVQHFETYRAGYEQMRIARIKTTAIELRDKLVSTQDSRELMIAIHQVLGLDHNGGVPRSILRDLWFEDKSRTLEFLDFLRDGFK